MHQDATWYGGRPRPIDIVLDGDPAPLPKRGGAPPQFQAHVYCGKTGAWIKMALGMEVGLGPDHIVQDGDPAVLPKKGDRDPQFSPISTVAKRLQSRRLCVRWGRSPPKEMAQPP